MMRACVCVFNGVHGLGLHFRCISLTTLGNVVQIKYGHLSYSGGTICKGGKIHVYWFHGCVLQGIFVKDKVGTMTPCLIQNTTVHSDTPN